MKREYLILAVLFVIALLIRLPSLDNPAFGDEYLWPNVVKYQLENGFSFNYQHSDGSITYWDDLPLSGIFYTIWGFVFSGSVLSLRVFSMLIGLLNIFLTFRIADRLFGRKTALWSVFLMGILSYWHLFESYMIERDGAFMMFFFLINFLVYLKYKENSKYLWLLVILLVVPFFVKVSAIFILAFVIIAMLFDKKIIQKLFSKQYKSFSAMLSDSRDAIILLSAIVPYILFLLITKAFFADFYIHAFGHSVPLSYISSNPLAAIGKEIVFMLLWGSPVFITLTLLSVFDKKDKFGAGKFYLLLWIVITLVGYSTSAYKAGLDRYLSVLIPAMSVLGACFLARINVKKYILRFVLITIIFYALLNLLAFVKVDYIFHSIKDYLVRAIAFDWSFYFPYYGAGGPSFMLSFIPIGFVMLMSVLLIVLVIMFRNHEKTFGAALLVLLSLTTAYSALVSQELIFGFHHPNVKNVYLDVVDYYNNNYDNEIVYTQMGLEQHLKNYKEAYFLDLDSGKAVYETISTNLREGKGGIALILNYPKTPPSHPRFSLFKDCELVSSFHDKNVWFGYIYDCN